ncbi:hypothetical protein ACQ7HM_10510 [Williamsia sp. MIQD14]|uniref:hypothetical protein n=1 Tax=Williamsia sp. MIQD14 TaxID=3425703 RepID=UPI003DA01B1E
MAQRDDVDRREGQRVRDAGTLSDALAVVYLDTLAPLTATLTGREQAHPASHEESDHK